MSNPNPFILGDTPNPCCWPGNGGGTCCLPSTPGGSQGINGFPNVINYVGGLPNCLDGQAAYFLPVGQIVKTKIGGQEQGWEVVSSTQPTTFSNITGTYTFIRAADWGTTGLGFERIS